MSNYPDKENPIGSAVCEILWYKQRDILLLYFKDMLYMSLTVTQEYQELRGGGSKTYIMTLTNVWTCVCVCVCVDR